MSNRFFRKDSKTEKSVPNGNNNNNNKKDFSERKSKLTPLEYRVTQDRETERPYSNKYNRHWESGTYHCVVCDAELFKSATKFESKSGWPAFYNVVDPKRVKLTADLSHIGANLLLLIAKPDLARTEVSCANCNAHLGHLFKDGPKPTGLRYCINSSSLRFSPANNSTDSETQEDNTNINSNYGNSPESDSNFQEFPCNPENSCGIRPPPNQKSSPTFTDSKSQTLPPMATLCLNNQECQRVIRIPNSSKVTKKSEFLSQSIEAIDTTTRIPNINSPPEEHPLFKKCTSYNKIGTGKTNNSTSEEQPKTFSDSPTSKDAPTPFTRGASARFSSSSKGASLTAARINFFQNLQQNKNNNGISSSSPASPFKNRFVSSISSGSLGLRRTSTENSNSSRNSKQTSNNERETYTKEDSRRGSNGFSITEKISSSPVPIKETEL